MAVVGMAANPLVSTRPAAIGPAHRPTGPQDDACPAGTALPGTPPLAYHPMSIVILRRLVTAVRA